MTLRSRLPAALFCTASLLMLAGCSSPFATGFLPTGYTYDDDTPITSPKPTQPWMDEAVITDTEALGANVAAWQGAVFELVDKLSLKLPAGQPLALAVVQPVTAQKQALDHYLRQALIQRGITIVPQEAAAALVTYDAIPLDKGDAHKLAVERLGREAVPEAKSNMKGIYLLRAIVSTSPKALLADEAVIAVLPGEKTEYSRWPGFTTQPAQGKSTSIVPVYEARD
jgi:hypothetical protein